jgi:lipopolysaccharide biosynthesis protein/GT2 family glycosyltransferase
MPPDVNLINDTSVFDKDWYASRNSRDKTISSVEGEFTASVAYKKTRIAVVFHAYHSEIISECIGYISNIPDCDLFVTGPHGHDSRVIREIVQAFPRATIITTPNRGRDIGPFIQAWSRISEYEICCKVHTKKGTTKFADSWRDICFGTMVGTKEIVLDIVNNFRRDPKLAIVGPESMYKSGARMIGANGDRILQLEAIIGSNDVPLDAPDWGFFAGSVFWFRPSLLSSLGKLSEVDFGAEDGAEDGGVAHAVERLFGSRILKSSVRIGYARKVLNGEATISTQQSPGTPDKEPYMVTLAKYADGQKSPFVVKGNIEGPAENNQVISGWLAVEGDNRSRRVALHFDEHDIHYIEANHRRDDLAAAKINDGAHAFVFEVPNTYKDSAFHTVKLIDTLSGTEVSRRQMRWAATLPDLFALTSRQSLAKTAIVLTGNASADVETLLADLNGFSSEFDLILPSNLGWEPFVENAYCKHISYIATTRTLSGAAFFVHLVNATILCRYENVCWLDIGGISPALTAVWHDGPSLILGDVGIAATIVSRQRAVQAPQLRSELIVEALTSIQRRKTFNTDNDVDVGHGALWIAPVILWQLRACNLNALSLNHSDGFNTLTCLLSLLAQDGDMRTMTIGKARQRREGIASTVDNELPFRTIAFFLPQFHRIPENDRWWSAGFTEWTNVVRARPLFEHHYQPKLPADLGFYDLRLPSTRAEQAALAKKFGVYGFCYYYYWFDGKKLLDQPIEAMLESKEPEMPFCICWANENWTRSWDGQNRFVLEKQNYSATALKQLGIEFIRFMRDPRYIRHQGRPVLVVYRISHIPDWMEIAEMWRQEWRDAGIGEVHLCAVRFGAEPLKGMPEDNGVDSYVMFPPHESLARDARSDVQDLAPDFSGQILDYDDAIAADLERFKNGAPWPVHRGAMLSWDNTARRDRESRVYVGATPLRFRSWMNGISKQIHCEEGREELVFVNAWNEWAEGTTFEPNQRFGLGYLEALRSVLEEANLLRANARLRLDDRINQDGPFHDMSLFEGRRKANAAWPTLLLCAHIAGNERFGGERSFVDVIEGIAKQKVNIVVTLPDATPYLSKQPLISQRPQVQSDYLDEILQYSTAVWSFRYSWFKDRPLEEDVVARFSHIIMKHQVNAVHANTIMLWEPLIAARRLGRKTIIHSRELIDRDHDLTGFMKVTAADAITHVNLSCDYMIANSRETARCFAHPNTFYVPNAAAMSDLDLKNTVTGKVRFSIVGSNIPKKGIIDFIKCATICQERSINAEFVIIGPENSLTAALKKGEGEFRLPSNIVFAGYRNTPREAIAEANVVMNLSHFAESFGRTVAEAMAARRPVIAYDWGALPELIDDMQSGFLVPYRDINAVVEKVAYFCERLDEITRMGEYGRNFVGTHFSQEVLANNLKGVYEVILKDSTIYDAPKSLAVIIPIYNAFRDTERCIASIDDTFHRTDGRIILIDDKSTDADISLLLDLYANDDRFEIIRNEKNIGYTKTINKAISHCAGSDIILLNSDTIVTPGWITGLKAAAYSRNNVGTATAMSDNAGAFSFPRSGTFNPKPDEVSHLDYARHIISHTANTKPVEVPTGSGFCMYIRAKLIEEIGLFDDISFPRGYGEENDYCMRALEAGWVNLVSPWAFVFHAKSASFGTSRLELVNQGMDAIARKHPAYNDLVKEAFSSSSMADLRHSAQVAVEELKSRRSTV